MFVKHVHFVHRPVAFSGSLLPEGAPDAQQYDGTFDTHLPDYTLTPLRLRPKIMRIVEGGSSEDITPQLANVRWAREIPATDPSGEKQLSVIQPSADYSFDGVTLLVRRNLPVQTAESYIFQAEWVRPDSRTVHPVSARHTVFCRAVTAPKIRFETQYPRISYWDPLRQPIFNLDLQREGTRLYRGAKPIDQSRYAIRIVSHAQDKGDGSAPDFHATLHSNAPPPATVFRYTIFALYNPYNDSPNKRDGSTALDVTATTPSCQVEVHRRIAPYQFGFTGVPETIPPGTPFLRPQVRAWDSVQPFSEEACQRVFLPVWYAVQPRSAPRVIGHGFHPVIPTEFIDPDTGCALGLDLRQLSGRTLLRDNQGRILACRDGEGNTIAIVTQL